MSHPLSPSDHSVPEMAPDAHVYTDPHGLLNFLGKGLDRKAKASDHGWTTA